MENYLVILILSIFVLLGALYVTIVEQKIIKIKDELLQHGHEIRKGKEGLDSTNKALKEVKVELDKIITESYKDLYKTVTNDINNLERKMDKKFEKTMTTLQQSIENKCSKEIIGPLYEAAKGKVAKQSSLYQGKLYPASSALDGNIGTFSHTNSEKNPSWWVDLGRLFRVVRIEVYSRKECCGPYLHHMDVTVGPSLDNMSLCTHYKGPAKTGEHFVLECEATMVGRFVKLSIIGHGIMQLAELKVFAYYHN
ncbi:fucolectin-like isoform X2 [Mytilus edulis]|uniref:fucolectin-like isoform X2 n=1 Tax=Mytilus edulis TaxID=6550 RepID=UPI0039F074A3